MTYSSENLTVGEAFMHDPLSVQDVLRGVRGGFQQLLEQRQAEVATNPPGFHFPRTETGDLMTLAEKAADLQDNSDSMLTESFVHASLWVGARRMDNQRAAQGLEPVHAAKVDELLQSEEYAAQFQKGNEDIGSTNHHKLRFAGPREVVALVERHIDPAFNNPVMVYDAIGQDYYAKRQEAEFGIANRGWLEYMKQNGWSPQLRALLAATGMHLSALKRARNIVMPLLEADDIKVPRVKEGFEDKFWGRKIVGAADATGLAHYMGYIQKSRPLLRHHMKRIWGEDYIEKRNTFMAASLMRMRSLSKQKEKEITELRRPIFAIIGEGYYAAAKERLQEIAKKDPYVFGRFSREWLLEEKESTEDSGDIPF
jgi:hypothetical protein